MDSFCRWKSLEKNSQIRGPMKKTIILALAMISSSAFSSQEIYERLAVEEQVLSTTRTETMVQKTAGGLTCFKKDHIENGPSFSCELETKNSDESAIYNALSVEETLIESTRTQMVYEKSLSSFQCMKTQDIFLGDIYNCKFKL